LVALAYGSIEATRRRAMGQTLSAYPPSEVLFAEISGSSRGRSDLPKYVDRAVAEAAPFFNEHLAARI
jgi:hypothetical protein